MTKHFAYFMMILSSVLIVSCINSEEYKNVKEDFRNTEYNDQWKSYDSIYKTIPDYKEISSTFSELHKGFNADILLDLQLADKFIDSKENAFGLGMFIADLGYARHYERVQYCSEYLEATRKIAGKLAIGEKEFNETVPLIESKLNDNELLFSVIDSLMNAGNVILASNEKHGISALFLAGFWIETTYLGLSLEDGEQSDKSKEALASHFKILSQINQLFACLDDDDKIDKIKSALLEIEKKGPENQNLYEDVVLIREKAF
jgi:hypothetical protein